MSEEKGLYKPADDFTPSEGMLERGMALQKVQTQYTTAIAVQRPRDIDKIQKAVLREAEYAGEAFYYSWTVSGKGGPKTIQGPSIGLTMSLAREWTNCAVDVAVETQGNFDIFTASFVDIEKGFTVKRAFKQRRSSAPGRYDAERWEDMEFQKAQSKAIRNVIASGVPRWLVNQAVDRAMEAVLKNISKEGIEAASASAIKFLGQYGVSEDRIIKRVGKPRNEWSSEDIAMLRGCASELKDGQSNANQLFPPEKENGKTLTTPDIEPKKDPYKVTEAPKEEAPHAPKNGIESWPCPACSFVAISERGLKKHQTQAHTKDEKAPDAPQVEPGPKTQEEGTVPQTWGDEVSIWVAEIPPPRLSRVLKDGLGIDSIHNIKEEERPDVRKRLNMEIDTMNNE